MTDRLEAAAAWSEPDEDDPDEVAAVELDEPAEDAVVDTVVDAVALLAPDVVVTVVPLVPLPDEPSPARLSSSPPVSTMAPATLATAAMRRPVWAGWGRRRRVRAGVVGTTGVVGAGG